MGKEGKRGEGSAQLPLDQLHHFLLLQKGFAVFFPLRDGAWELVAAKSFQGVDVRGKKGRVEI